MKEGRRGQVKLKESLFWKLFCSGLFIVTLAATVAGGIFIAFLSQNGYLSENGYFSSNDLYRRLQIDAQAVEDYETLLYEEESGSALTFDDQLRKDSLEAQIGLTGTGNFLWQLVDDDGRVIRSNIAADQGSLQERIWGGHMFNMDIQVPVSNGEPILVGHLLYGVRQDLDPGIADGYTEDMARFIQLSAAFVPVLTASIVCGLLSLLLFCYLLSSAGHRPGGETAVLNPFDRIWLEVPILMTIFCLVFLFEGIWSGDPLIVGWMAIFSSILVLITLLTVVRRVKAKSLYQTTFFYQVIRLFRALLRHVGIAVRVILIATAYILAQLVFILGMVNGSVLAGFIWVMGNLSVVALVILVCIQYERLEKATERMAQGNLGVVIDEKTVTFFQPLARNLNNSSSAIQTAVEKATHSERMKTELITNVSHDIKTPLTSIISYVGLLKALPNDDPQAKEYIQVLDRKSRRLAQLVSDLIEASKVTAGAVDVHMESINLGELVKQAAGEFESRFQDRHIQLMSRLPEQPVLAYADGRHMWRVLDNLFSNASKYALEGTRIYLDLADLGNEVVLSLKNISRDPLNMQPDELTERFVRGDQARVGEGSGLGLSIARSLMELQKGSMDVQIDGDLFKVVLTLPKI